MINSRQNMKMNTYSGRGREGHTTCESTRWKSSSSVDCKLPPGIRASLTLSITVGMGVSSISDAISYNSPVLVDHLTAYRAVLRAGSDQSTMSRAHMLALFQESSLLAQGLVSVEWLFRTHGSSATAVARIVLRNSQHYSTSVAGTDLMLFDQLEDVLVQRFLLSDEVPNSAAFHE